MTQVTCPSCKHECIHTRTFCGKVVQVSRRNNFLTANQSRPSCLMHNLFHFNFNLFRKCYIWLISTVMELYTVHPLRAYVTSEAEIFSVDRMLLLTRLLVVHICIFTLCLVHSLASLCISRSKEKISISDRMDVPQVGRPLPGVLWIAAVYLTVHLAPENRRI